jgi:hypothetical protein
MRYVTCVAAIFIVACGIANAQSPNATLNGQVLDSSGGVIAGADIDAVNVATNVKYSTKTNSEGMYLLPDLPPATYEIQVSHAGFKTIVKPDVLLNVRDAVVINFTLPLGAVSERVTVEGGAPLIDTQDAAVGTVVDRQFAENLPMNGRSFQTLIQLTPGVVLTTYNNKDTGQFSVNGQRPSSNYWMVDGVGANVGIGTSNASAGNGLAGANASFSVLGGTNSLVSVDAMQEFRIQTSTFAPEFGRAPGAQISIVTRSGTNQFHGTAFDYLRNDVLDANNWFADSKGLPKPKERQNDFGGTFSGPLLKDRTFFFFSYEGLRLRLPQTALTTVPDASFTPGGTTNSRQSATPAMQPYLNAYPLPNSNSPEIFTPCSPNVNGCPSSGQQATGSAAFNGSFSNPASLDAYSLRIDHKVGSKLNVFGRYNYSPSTLDQRGTGGESLSSVVFSKITLQTLTGGLTWSLAPSVVNDLRLNYSRTNSISRAQLDNFGGAIPLASFPLPNGFNTDSGRFFFAISSLAPALGLDQGFLGHNIQHQFNVVDGLTVQKGSHDLKFGVDFRRLTPSYGNAVYFQNPNFTDVPSTAMGDLFFAPVQAGSGASYVFHNLGAYAQDSWRITERLTITYGLRWDLDFAPSSTPPFLSVVGFNLKDLSNLALEPSGTAPFRTTYGNAAPRIGLAYRLRESQNWQTVVRGGFGIFYDLATSEIGNSVNPSNFPFGATKFAIGSAAGGTSTFPLSPADAAPPAITPANLQVFGAGGVFDPHLELPYALQWNITLEQALGAQQTLSASYIGSAGRRLLQTALVIAPSATFAHVSLTANTGTSDYDSLQLQFRRRLSKGLQALASYSWSHSIDTGSAGSIGVFQNVLTSSTSNANRGPSDFDIRNGFSAAMTWDIPGPKTNAVMKALLHRWSIENVAQARSAPPVTVVGPFSAFSVFAAQVRPDVKPGVPLYLFGSQCVQTAPAAFGQPCPGGKGFNPNAFTLPPSGQQGDLGRNALRAFGAWQWDSAVHRDFAIRESLKLQFRAEMFNILNHPNFAPPVSTLGSSQFGLSTQTLGSYLAGLNIGSGAFNPLYQIGGPRSVQFGLKVQF